MLRLSILVRGDYGEFGECDPAAPRRAKAGAGATGEARLGDFRARRLSRTEFCNRVTQRYSTEACGVGCGAQTHGSSSESTMGEVTERPAFRGIRESSRPSSCETDTFNRGQAQNRSSATSKVGAGPGTTIEESRL